MKDQDQEKLLRLARQLDWKTYSKLLQEEDKFIEAKEVIHIEENVDAQMLRYLALGSIPFVIHQNSYDYHVDRQKYKDILNQLWPFDWLDIKHPLIEIEWHGRLPTLPRGNLHPKIMIVGDSPGIGSSPGLYDRTMTWGPSSVMLRKSLLSLNVYTQCWFTNLVKISQYENKPTTVEAVKEWKNYLLDELRLLQPDIVLLLGDHVESMFEEFQPFGVLAYANKPTKVVKIYHPSYIARKNINPEDYGKHIQQRIQEAKER